MGSCWCPSSTYRSLSRAHSPVPFNPRRSSSYLFFSTPRKPSTIAASVKIGVEEIASVLQNKALVAATVAATVGQMTKIFRKALKGGGVDLKIRSGGMPSVHSAAVVAASASLGLERGFSDSVFGMSVVIASIIMYDAQGVRREVGDHAKYLNASKEIQVRSPSNMGKDDLSDSRPEIPISSERLIPFLSSPENPKSGTVTEDPPLAPAVSQQALTRVKTMRMDLVEDASCDIVKFNESVGHTEIQVLAGAFLGLLVACAVETIV